MKTAWELVSPKFTSLGPKKAFQEVWYLKCNDPAGPALWLRWTLLRNPKLQKSRAETWAIFFEGPSQAPVLLKDTFDFESFNSREDIRISDCVLNSSRTAGKIKSSSSSINWDLSIETPEELTFDFVPNLLKQAGLVKNSALTVQERILFSGQVEVQGRIYNFSSAPGMLGHLFGPKNGHSWAWGHCNMFEEENGKKSDLVFDGLTAKARLGKKIVSPQLSCFFFRYNGKSYVFNSTWGALTAKSSYSAQGWSFEVGRGDLRFKASIEAKNQKFAEVVYEDTDGSQLYCSNSKNASMCVEVFRNGKLENTLIARHTAAFEVVHRGQKSNLST